MEGEGIFSAGHNEVRKYVSCIKLDFCRVPVPYAK